MAAAKATAGLASLGAALVLSLSALGCGTEVDLGSDVLWTARFEGATFDEWTVEGGGAEAYPTPPNLLEISEERARRGRFAAKLTIDAATEQQQTSQLVLRRDLPPDAYYSAWYYLPRSVNVETFWVIAKFRTELAATADELYDLDLVNLPGGEMTLVLYDHRLPGRVPLELEPVVPVGQWFQVEARFRNVPDDRAHVTVWVDGRRIVDLPGTVSPGAPWLEWYACSIGARLSSGPAVLYVDDAAMSRSRVGPTGFID